MATKLLSSSVFSKTARRAYSFSEFALPSSNPEQTGGRAIAVFSDHSKEARRSKELKIIREG